MVTEGEMGVKSDPQWARMLGEGQGGVVEDDCGVVVCLVPGPLRDTRGVLGEGRGGLGVVCMGGGVCKIVSV